MDYGICSLFQSLYSPVTQMVSEMILCKKERPFDRRCTAMEWHPTKPNIVAVGSKGGDIIFLDINSDKNCDKFIQGVSESFSSAY